MAQITITKTIEQGDSITIQANPGENYSFGGWIFDPNQSPVRTNPYTYTPNSSDNIEAVFNITDPLVVVCSDKEDTVGRYLYLVNKNDQVKYWYLQTGTNTYTGNDPGWELDNIKTFYGDTYYPRGSKPSVDGKVGANHIISIDAHSLVGVQYLPDTAFFNQKALTSITLPLYLQYVGDGEYCTDGTTYRGVFEGCTSLATVNFGNDYTYSGPLWRLSFIRKIWNWAFGGCTSLTSVSIPTYGISSQNSSNDDLEICANAFSGCTSLSSFTVNNRFNTHRVKSIGNYCFNGCNFTTFNLPNYGGALQSIGINPFYGCKRLASYTQENSNASIRVEGRCIVNRWTNTLVSGNCYMDTSNLTTNCTTLGEYAFASMGDTSHTTFNLPDSITIIKQGALCYNLYLQNVLTTSNSSLTTIERYAFDGDKRLQLVDLYSLNQFGNNANNSATCCFRNCADLLPGLVIKIRTNTVPTIYTQTGTGILYDIFPEKYGNTYHWSVEVEPGMYSSYYADGQWNYWCGEGRVHTKIHSSADVDPNNSGSVSGTGDVSVSTLGGTSTTLTATANRGYSFNNWTRSGVSVSSSNPFTFTVQDTASGTINTTANFNTLASYTISGSVNDPTYGTISGTGSYYSGESCTLTATSNTGYEFVNWTENGTTVSSDSTYTFTVSGNRTLVANFQSSTPPRTITATADAADVLYLYNSSNQTYTWNLTPGTNILTDGDVSGFGFDTIRSIYKNTNSSATYQTTGLTTLDISELTMMQSVRSYAFYRVGSLTSITLPRSITTLNNYCFAATSLTQIPNLNSSITVIPDYCFDNCQQLTEIKLLYIQKIYQHGFSSCNRVSKVVLPSIRQINSYAFNFLGQRDSVNSIYYKFGNYRNSGYGTYWDGRLQIDNNAFGSDSISKNKITDIYINTCEGPTQVSSTSLSTAITTNAPNSSFIVHVDEDDIEDETYWDIVNNIPSARKRYDVWGMYENEFN